MNILPFFWEGRIFVNDANFAFLLYMYTKRHLLKIDYLFCIVLVWSEPQQVFEYMEYLKSLFYNHILSVIPTRLMKLDATVTSNVQRMM